MNHPNLTCPAFEAQLPEYLEGTLSDSAVADAELHLASCADCRALVADLREITRQAAVLPGMTPSRDLWPEIEARTHARVLPLTSRVRPAPLSHWRLGAVAAALVGITALSTWVLATRERSGDAPPMVARVVDTTAPVRGSVGPAKIDTPAVPSAEAPAATPVANTERAPRPDAGTTYTSEIHRLRDVVDERSAELDPATVAILKSSIATIDTAIAQARRALERDPASGFLNQQLNKSLERKLGLLRKAALLSPSA
jgi:hypothetical protein